MSLINRRSSNGRRNYSLMEDCLIIVLCDQEQSNKQIESKFKELGFNRTEAGIGYRITRQLSKEGATLEGLHNVETKKVDEVMTQANNMLNPEAAEPKAAEPKAAEPKTVEPKTVEPKAAKPQAAKLKAK